jgi:membrane-associated phospholipid phosphatase
VTIVTALYFAYLAGMGIVRRSFPAVAVSIAATVLILTIGMPHFMPLVFLLVGYWVPALLVREPNVELERRLLDFDRQLFGPSGLARFEWRAPRVVIEYLELAYLLCYAVVPAGYVWLLLAGRQAAEVDRFWSIVLLASFICYGLLPLMPTRAPRAIEPVRDAARSSIRQINLAVLNRASVQWNTFPSGHTAASAATALAIASDSPVAGFAFAAIAVSIAAGSVVGRYHYAADAITGGVAAAAAFVMVSAVRGL